MTYDTLIHGGDRPHRQARFLPVGLIVTVLACGAVVLASNDADPDLWGHIQYGRDTLRDGVAQTTSYSYSADGYRWINHELLAEALLAIGADTIGARGLLWAKCLAGLAVMCLVLRHAGRNGTNLVARCATVLVLAAALASFWSLRPQLMSYVYFTLMLVLLAWCFEGWEGGWHLPRRLNDEERRRVDFRYSPDRMRSLWLAPVLFMLWANTHGGFLAGLAVYIAYLGLRGVEAFACRGRAAWGYARRLTLMAVVATVATGLNPYGLELHRWLFESLSVARPEITEWHPPNLLSVGSWPVWLLLGTILLSLTLSRRSRDFTQLVLLGLIMWQSMMHERHIPFLALAAAFWLPPHFSSALSRLRIVSDDLTEEPSAGLRWVVGATLLAVVSLLAVRLHQRLSGIPVHRDEYPVEALQFAADEGLNGRMVVTYNWAQYVIAAFGTQDDPRRQIEVGFDGRFRTCYPQQIVDMHFDLVLGDLPGCRRRGPDTRFDPKLVLHAGRPDLVLIRRSQQHSARVMASTEQWVLLYQDALAQIWGRADRYDDVESAYWLPPSRRRISDLRQTGSVAWPALPRHPQTLAMGGSLAQEGDSK